MLLCQNTAMLGWRRDVTKIVVLITDAPQHISGDGLVAGIWKPYKHECSLVDVRIKPCYVFVKLREREGQRVDLGRTLKGHL